MKTCYYCGKEDENLVQEVNVLFLGVVKIYFHPLCRSIYPHVITVLAKQVNKTNEQIILESGL